MKENISFQKSQDDYYSNNDDGYIGAQYSNTLESTKQLYGSILEVADSKNNNSFLDAGCGDGSVINFLHKKFPDSSFSGFDISKAMVSYAKESLPINISIKKGDLLDMSEYATEKHDIVYSIHTLSLFPSFEPVLQELIKSTKSHLFVNSIFSDQNIDSFTTIKEPNFPDIQWNSFSMQRVEKYLIKNGATKVNFKRLYMPFDLTKPKEGMGSFTKELMSGERLTFSGPLFLPWYILRADFNK